MKVKHIQDCFLRLCNHARLFSWAAHIISKVERWSDGSVRKIADGCTEFASFLCCYRGYGKRTLRDKAVERECRVQRNIRRPSDRVCNAKESILVKGRILHHIYAAHDLCNQPALLPFRKASPVELGLNFSDVFERKDSKILEPLLEREEVHIFPERVENNMFGEYNSRDGVILQR